MIRIVTAGIISVATLSLAATSAMADFYVMKEASGCRVVETATNAKPDGGNYGEKHLTQADADAAMAKDPECKK